MSGLIGMKLLFNSMIVLYKYFKGLIGALKTLSKTKCCQRCCCCCCKKKKKIQKIQEEPSDNVPEESKENSSNVPEERKEISQKEDGDEVIEDVDESESEDDESSLDLKNFGPLMWGSYCYMNEAVVNEIQDFDH